MGGSGLVWRPVIAASLLCLVLGSVHAFSVFLETLEARFAISRAMASLSYSFALVALTGAVLVGPTLTRGLSGARVMLIAGWVAATGAGVAALAPGIGGVWLGYSLLFGAANGLGYGYGLQAAARGNPGREGLAMGLVTAAYALGATGAPVVFVRAMGLGGFSGAMLALAAALVLTAGVSSLMMQGTKPAAQAPRAAHALPPWSEIACLWLAYGAGVGAGLMIIGHAASIAQNAGVALIWLAPTLVAGANMLGSVVGGRSVDLGHPGRVLIGLALAGAVSLLAIGWAPTAAVALTGLAVVGGLYGATIAVMPAMIARDYGMARSASIYGRVFTAWGLAGLAGPWAAGLLYDRSGGYDLALLVAAAMSILSAAAGLVYLRLRAVPGRPNQGDLP